jgi:glycerophosphoryl diester phosphodiesterase
MSFRLATLDTMHYGLRTIHTPLVAIAVVPLMLTMPLPHDGARQAQTTKIAVAHRGASAYAPEHTRAAYQLALDQRADYVEQDLAVTKDGALVCLHDDSLERTTNVEELFPDRFTLDEKGRKRWLAVDFTLAEIKRLDAGSWFAPKFAGERVPTWDQAVDLVWGKAGMYPELKAPALYRARGVDMVAIFARLVRARKLDAAPARGTRPPLVLQSFDEQTVRDLARVLPTVPRTLLIGSEEAAGRLLGTAASVKAIAQFATDIGPAKQLIEQRPDIVKWAHDAGLTVTPYTFRSSATGRFADVTAEMRFFLFDLGVDALFTDNPDLFPRRQF